MPLLTTNIGAAPDETWEAEFDGCYARFEANQTLTIGNKLIERSWEVRNGLLFSRSLRDLTTGTEWLEAVSPYPVMYPLVDLPEEPRSLGFAATPGRRNLTEEPSLLVELSAGGEELKLIYRFQIFPGSSGISQQLLVERNLPTARLELSGADKTKGSTVALIPDGIEGNFEPQTGTGGTVKRLDLLDYLQFKPRHLRLTGVSLLEQTDSRNEIVFENEWLLHTSEKSLGLSGNLFFIENTLTGAGLSFLKLSPLPPARPFKPAHDLLFEGPKNALSFLGHGHPPDMSEPESEGYQFVILAYANGPAGRTEVLQNYQRQLRSYEPDRDGRFFTNTWGDRSRDGRITQAFIQQEIDLAATMGADVVQIDDGWQNGRTANSILKNGVWEGFWQTDQGFWQPNLQRLPGGLEPLVKQARALGLELGLWFGADSYQDFANWQHDADTLLGYYRDLGIKYFKIDAIKMISKVGEKNIRQFFQRVLELSNGEAVLELDVTADIRPGYFGMLNSGPIFVENRYTDWHNYWPHQTLRNFWKLAHYIDPLRMRMEFLNNARNTGLYQDDPLAPATYHPAYLFAVTMFANPLGWFEISSLPSEYIEEVGRLAKIWKEHRSAIFAGRIFPVGNAPDGTSWTGFISIGKDRQEGYALVFRELNSIPNWACSLPVSIEGRLKIEILWGEGSAQLDEAKLEVQIAAPQTFIFLKFSR